VTPAEFSYMVERAAKNNGTTATVLWENYPDTLEAITREIIEGIALNLENSYPDSYLRGDEIGKIIRQRFL
jgi:hypothetical protein